MTIEFPDRPEPWYDIEYHTIAFFVRVNGHPCSFVVTADGLVAHFGGCFPCTPLEALQVFEDYKDVVRRSAEAVIRFDPAPRPLTVYAVDLSGVE